MPQSTVLRLCSGFLASKNIYVFEHLLHSLKPWIFVNRDFYLFRQINFVLKGTHLCWQTMCAGKNSVELPNNCMENDLLLWNVTHLYDNREKNVTYISVVK